MFQRLAALLAAVVLAGASHAATETFDFTGYHAGETYHYEATKEFTGTLGNTVEVSMGTFDWSIYHTGWEGYGLVGQWAGYGLGACTYLHYGYCYEQDVVDGWGPNEYLQFTLEDNAVLESITFLNYGDGTYDLTTMDGDVYWSAPIGADIAGTEVGTTFFIGAYNGAGFLVESITVSYSDVPLPAAGFLLLGGLGGIVALRRRI